MTGLSRRALLGAAGGLAAAALAGCGERPGAGPVKVGVLHSLTGSVAISEAPINDATLMAIDEVNAAGGLLGRRLDPIVVDGRSDWPAFAAAIERLITVDKVAVVFGCYTSASRRTVVPIVERHDTLLVYPTFYEGLELSPNILYTGACPNQFITPAMRWFFDNRGKSFFLAGSDYVFPHATNAVIRDQLGQLGAKICGEEYLLLGETRVEPVIKEILRTRPEVIVSTVVGDTNIPFFRALRSAGITPKVIPTVSVVINEIELPSLDPRQMAGDYVGLNYFQSVPSAENQRFVRDFQARFGADRVIGDPMEAAYFGVHLWAQAVRSAESLDTRLVREALRGQRFRAPSGTVYVDEVNLHTWKKARIGQIRPDGQLSIVWTSEAPIHPVPYAVYRTRQQWDEMLASMYAGWGNGWARPA
ncbi:urea ABC transporter substrate-binding protein [Longispora albida]|uniref:urea ABC transporter substrate-binding protein n=1 Tax=Longispora albida TaxID=203523 RepID=UPI00037AF281|nr:urea ABC transporter substrate-binding protein [Longispora albida]